MNRIQSKQSHCVYQPLVELSLKGVSDISINVDYQKLRRYKIPIICCFIKKKKKSVDELQVHCISKNYH